MLVNRRTFIIKKPYFEDALRLLVEYRELVKLVDVNAIMRIYSSEIGSFDTIACELETVSLSEFERAFAEFRQHPTAAIRLPDWFKRWQEITEPGGMNEFWRLVE